MFTAGTLPACEHAIRQVAMRDKRDNYDNPGRQHSDQYPEINGLISQFHSVALQEQHHLETFTVERGKAEQSEPEV